MSKYTIGQIVWITAVGVGGPQDVRGIYRGTDPTGGCEMVAREDGVTGAGPNGEWLCNDKHLYASFTQAPVPAPAWAPVPPPPLPHDDGSVPTPREWQVGDEVEFLYSDDTLTGHFGFITRVNVEIPGMSGRRIEVKDRTNLSRGLGCNDDIGPYKLWYADYARDYARDEASLTLRLRAPAAATLPRETRIGLVREEIDWSAHEEMKRLALGNAK
jgi:hypothetical protein